MEELHAKLAGVPFAGVDDAVTRLAAHRPTRNEAHLRDLAERMARAERSKDLLQHWKEAVGFPAGMIDAILALSDPPWYTACPNPFLSAFMEAYDKPCDPAGLIAASSSKSMSTKATPTPSFGRTAIALGCRTS